MKKKLLLFIAIMAMIANGIAAQDSWTKKENFVGNRVGTIHFSIGDKGYVGSGSDDVNIKSDFWEFDPANNEWTQKADYGGGIRAYATSFTIGNKGYAGTGIAGSYIWRKDMWEYNPASNSWRRVADFGTGLPDALGGGFRYTAVGFGIGNKGYMGTGNYRISPAYLAIYLNDFWEFDPLVGDSGTWTRKADVPEQGRSAAIGLNIENKGYIGTGFYYYDTRKKDWWEYDVVADHWNKKADIPGSQRYGASAFSIGNKGYLGMGWNYTGLNDLWEYNSLTDVWIQKASLPGSVRHIGTSFAIGHKGFFGLGSNSIGALNDFWEYSPSAEIKPAVTFDPVYVGTYAGNGEAGFADGISTTAKFNYPTGVAADAFGNIYVADNMNHRIRKITPQGFVSTFAGNGSPGFSDGLEINAQFNRPHGLAVDNLGNVYVADENNHRIRKITPAGVVSTLAGNGTRGFADGEGSAAQFNFPQGVTVDAEGNVFVADTYNQRIRKITPTGFVSTIAGNGLDFPEDGYGTDAQFLTPNGLAFDMQGNLFITQFYSNLRKMNKLEYVATISTHPNIYNTFHQGIVVDKFDYVYISIENGQTKNLIYRISPNGSEDIFAGTVRGYKDGIGTEAQFGWLAGLAVDSAGNIFVSDAGNNCIRKMTAPEIHCSTISGTASASQFFSISGTNLSENIHLTAPAGYEISQTMSSGYTSALALTPLSGEINTDTIYIRLTAALAAGNYHGNISLSTDGALTKWLPVSGTVTDTIPPVIQCVAPQLFCFNAGNGYTIPVITASDISGIGNITFSISGATVRNGTGSNASGIFNPGMNRILWTVTDNAGNSGTCTTTVIINHPVQVNISDVFAVNPGGKANTIYIGYGPTSVTLTANGSGGYLAAGNHYSYVWSAGATTSSINVSPAIVGTYIYTVTITDDYGCTATASKTITVVDVRCGNKLDKVTICKVPPGNPGNSYEYCVSNNAVAAHLNNGSYLGNCSSNLVTSAGRIMQPSEEITASTTISIVPNPNNGSFSLQLNNLDASAIRIVDLHGKIVYSQGVYGINKTQTLFIHPGNLTKGMYVVQAIHKGGISTCKMIVQ